MKETFMQASLAVLNRVVEKGFIDLNDFYNVAIGREVRLQGHLTSANLATYGECGEHSVNSKNGWITITGTGNYKGLVITLVL